MIATKWEKGVRVQVRLCRGCGLVLLCAESVRALPEFHQSCMAEAMRTDQAREWLSARHRDRIDGKPLFAINRSHGQHIPTVTAPTRRDPEILKRHLTWAIRHHLGGVSHAALASETGVSRQRVAKAIDEILAMLPLSDLLHAQFRPLIQRLTERVGASHAEADAA